MRTDYLEDLWEKTISEHVDDETKSEVIFNPSRREFNLEAVDERTRLSVAVRMLLQMHHVPEDEKIMIQTKTLDEIKSKQV